MVLIRPGHQNVLHTSHIWHLIAMKKNTVHAVAATRGLTNEVAAGGWQKGFLVGRERTQTLSSQSMWILWISPADRLQCTVYQHWNGTSNTPQDGHGFQHRILRSSGVPYLPDQALISLEFRVVEIRAVETQIDKDLDHALHQVLVNVFTWPHIGINRFNLQLIWVVWSDLKNMLVECLIPNWMENKKCLKLKNKKTVTISCNI